MKRKTKLIRNIIIALVCGIGIASGIKNESVFLTIVAGVGFIITVVNTSEA
jgi:hypothetical protein